MLAEGSRKTAFGSKDSNAAFVSTPLTLAGTPESLASQKHKQSLIVSPTGHRLLQVTPLSATHRRRRVLSRTHRLNGRFLSREHKPLSIEMETHQFDCWSSLGVIFNK